MSNKLLSHMLTLFASWISFFDKIFTCIATFCALSRAVCLRLQSMSAFAPYLDTKCKIAPW